MYVQKIYDRYNHSNMYMDNYYNYIHRNNATEQMETECSTTNPCTQKAGLANSFGICIIIEAL